MTSTIRMQAVSTVIAMVIATVHSLGLTCVPISAQQPSLGFNESGEMVAYGQPIPGSHLNIKMVPVPAGQFARPDSEAINVPAFWIGKYEVTCSQYGEFMKLYDVFVALESRAVKDYTTEDPNDGVTAPTPVYEPTARFMYSFEADSPAPSMSQFAARQFTKWLSLLSGVEYRLPSETEWQYACFAGGSPTPIKELDLAAKAVFGRPLRRTYQPSRETLLRVGTKQPNGFGIHDMLGSLAEYVIEDAVFAAQSSPQRPRTHRAYGGSFADQAKNCRWNSFVTVDQQWWEEDAYWPRSTVWLASVDKQVTVGFRIVRTPVPMSDQEKSIAWDPDSKQLSSDNAVRIDEGRQRAGRVDTKLPRAIREYVDQPVLSYAPWDPKQ